MLTSSCPRTIDEPVRLLGLDNEDWAVVGILGLLVYLMTTATIGALVIALLVVGVRLIKRGQPPGAMLHTLWLLGMPVRGWPAAPPPDGRRYSPWP